MAFRCASERSHECAALVSSSSLQVNRRPVTQELQIAGASHREQSSHQHYVHSLTSRRLIIFCLLNCQRT
jgi:hypothetical protein